MKIDRKIKLLGLLLGVSLLHTVSHAQPTTLIGFTNTFDNNGNTTPYQSPDWIYWYSIYQNYYGLGYNLPMTNDPSMDAANDPNSGSLYVLSPFDASANQNVFYGTFGENGPYDQSSQIKIALVTNISYDIHVLQGSQVDANGNFGQITPFLIANKPNNGGFDAGTSYLTNSLTIPGAATNGWVHMAETNVSEFAWYAVSSGYTYAFGVGFDYNSYGGYPTAPVTFWIDNVVVNTGESAPPPPPPPSLSIAPAYPGLNLFAGSGTALYNRQDLETVNNDYSWVGASGPVSYSFTITNFAVSPGDGFQNQIFLIPNPAAGSAPDYSESNVVFLDLDQETTGVTWSFRYKTNGPNGGSMLYGSGSIASINSSNAVGTWTVTFNQNTNVTMTTPSGASTNFSIPDSTGETTALFANGVVLFYGVQGNNTAGASDHITTSDFKVTGLGAASFDDNFVADNGVLNTSIWEVNAQDPAAVFLLPQGSAYFVKWTVPALGFSLYSTTNLENPDFLPVAGSVNQYGAYDTQVVSVTNSAGSDQFFALVEPVFSQLQVLLPGETAAPNTPTGKTGTPTPQTAGNYFTVTVNAVDAHWNLVSSASDTVSLSSSDTNAYINPTTVDLAQGTGQFTVILDNSGETPVNDTVTATDVTDPTKSSNTSSSVEVDP